MANAARSGARLAQLQRHFSTSSATRKEIQDAYIVGAARTPVGVFNGAYTTLPATRLGATAIRAAISRSKLDPTSITSVYMGNVLSAGVGQAPARQASIYAGLSPTVEATTVNKVCASGLKAVALAAQDVQLGLATAVVAGGMENMSRTPYLISRASQMPAFGEVSMKDSMIADGLWDPYNNIHMGNCAENTVKKFEISRKAQDDFAIESYRRAQAAWKSGAFADEVVEVEVPGKKKGSLSKITEDEGPSRINFEKVPTLKPAFDRSDKGTVTAANASSFNDGASAVVVTNKELAAQVAGSSRVLAKILSTADAATDPIDFTIAPAKAIPIALERAGLSMKDIAVFEINEAFAAVVIANAKILGLESEEDMKKVNPLGGAIALGHAIGSSGSRILVTMLHRLKVGEIGCAAICNGGGAASCMIVQRVDSV